MALVISFSFSVRNPEGRIRLYCKGADTVLLERLHPCDQELMNITSDHLNVSGQTLIDGGALPSSVHTLQSTCNNVFSSTL